MSSTETYTLELSKGFKSVVDAEVFEDVSKHKWTYTHQGYAVRSFTDDGKRRIIYLHRYLMNAKTGEYVDHINGDRLDNRKSNLRICTNAQNAWNQPKKRQGSSKYKGVSFWKRDNNWTAQITHNYKPYKIGYFDTEEDAAAAYNAKALELYGEFANINQIL
jgi:hypothetical protein